MLSHRHPALYALAVGTYRLRRHARWWLEDRAPLTCFATGRACVPLAVRVKKHQSRLLRRLGDSEMWLQHNKVHNLALAIRPLDGLLIRPGETFSFWRAVGRPTRERGYIHGMELSRGRARPGVGGGICQLASVLHWLVLHSPLEVTQRSMHSFDPFPDEQRSIPWGTGCSVFYNYVDFQFHNPTPTTFQLRLGLTERFLEAELRASQELPCSYSIFERDHAFERAGGQTFRTNTLWRRVCDRRTGTFLRNELVKRNRARVVYSAPVT
jgi:vancomycin resistance protein VanW